MKKMIVAFAALCLLFVGCGDTPLAPGGTLGASLFSPPTWIIGTWGDAGNYNVFTFSAHNIVFSTTGASVDFAETYKAATVAEETSTTRYRVSIAAYGVTQIYLFEKSTTVSVAYSLTSGGVTMGPITLTKK